MKDGHGNEIRVGDTVRRIDEFCFGRIPDKNYPNGWAPACNPPPPGAVVIDFTSQCVITRPGGVYIAETLEVVR